MHQRKNWCECTKRKKKSQHFEMSLRVECNFRFHLGTNQLHFAVPKFKFESELFCFDKLYQVVAIQMKYSILL